jgi:hypothetical protein
MRIFHMLKINIGLSKKVGEPNYGSRGASVNLELEVEAGLAGQPEELQDRIRRLFRLAKSSVDEELNGNGGAGGGQTGHGESNGNGHGHHQRNRRPATASQARAIRAIAGRQRIDLQQLLGDRFGVSRPEDLSISDASQLIDDLKGAAEGRGVGR